MNYSIQLTGTEVAYLGKILFKEVSNLGGPFSPEFIGTECEGIMGKLELALLEPREGNRVLLKNQPVWKEEVHLVQNTGAVDAPKQAPVKEHKSKREWRVDSEWR